MNDSTKLTGTPESDDVEARAFDERIVELWQPVSLSQGFADRVIDRRRRETGRLRRGIGRSGAAVAAAAAVLLILGLGWRSRRHAEIAASGGEVAPSTRTTVDLAGRGRAVVEAGALVRWSVRRGEASVSQTAGEVFYRVDPGGPFVVTTPLGEVRVTGTCFRVEVSPMKPMGAAGLLGAGALIGALAVTVYEGFVQVRNDAGDVRATAGEQARVDGTRAPRLTDSAGIAAPQRALQLLDQSARVRPPHERRAAADASAPPPSHDATTAPNSANLVPSDRRYDLTHDELRRLAQRCEVRFDAPGWKRDGFMEAKDLARSGLPPVEQELYAAVMKRVQERVLETWRSFYVEATGDKDSAHVFTLGELDGRVQKALGPERLALARRQVSRELAGLTPAPADPQASPLAERMIRSLRSIGDEFERDLAKDVGPTRAREIRRDPFSRRLDLKGCPEGLEGP